MVLVPVLTGCLGLGAAGCSSVGGKAVEHKVRKALPGVDTKGERIFNKADRVVGDDEGGLRREDRGSWIAVGS
jgi:hypothetical protein